LVAEKTREKICGRRDERRRNFFFLFLETIRDKRELRERQRRERHLYSRALLNHISFFYGVRY
jgi:hypothetical protein